MPNWCYNNLIVEAKTLPELTAFKEATTGPGGFDQSEEEQELSFDALVPVPPDVLAAGFDKLGYDWCLQNWGTKWDADIICADTSRGDLSLAYEFETAWTAPLEWLRKVATEYFPNLRFTLDYNGGDFQGQIVWSRGKLVYSEETEIRVDTDDEDDWYSQ